MVMITGLTRRMDGPDLRGTVVVVVAAWFQNGPTETSSTRISIQ